MFSDRHVGEGTTVTKKIIVVAVDAVSALASAQKEGDKADGAKKEKLLAECSSACSA